MPFDPKEHLRKLKGQDYLDCKWRLMWLREEHPDASIATELIHMDTEKGFYMFKAHVSIPGKGAASGHGSETDHDFPLGAPEKAETKAIGRALAALGFGTQFALELDEGDRVVDAPVTASTRSTPSTASPAQRAGLKVVAEEQPAALKVVAEEHLAKPVDPFGAVDPTESLRREVAATLAANSDAAARLPKTAEEMTLDELEKTMTWLRNRGRSQRQA